MTFVLPLHAGVSNAAPVNAVEIAEPSRPFHEVAWSDLSNLRLSPGLYTLRFEVPGGDHVAVEIPTCSGRKRVLLDGADVRANGSAPAGAQPLLLRLPVRPERAYEVDIEVDVGTYEHRIACGFSPRFGAESSTRDGLQSIAFPSPSANVGGGHAVVFVPPGHDATKPGALLVGLHPWNGSIWTYAAYAELLREAAARDVVLLMPSGLGNSLYTAAAEEETLRAIDALEHDVAVDPARVSIWGASMGGAGATTIGFHHPDKFASVTSFFGDSKYDLDTYVKAILHDEAGAHLVNALDVVDNARNVPVWLIHGEDDKVSPIAQSTMLAKAMQDKGFAVQLDRVPHAGHEGAVVAKFAAAVVDRAATTRAPSAPSRVTFRSVRSMDTSAYGVKITKTGGDAFVDLELGPNAILVHEAKGVKAIELASGSFGKKAGFPIAKDPPCAAVDVHWQTTEPDAAKAQ